MKFRVWGVFAGEAFDKTFPSVNCWQAWKRLMATRYEIEVLGMQSVEEVSV